MRTNVALVDKMLKKEELLNEEEMETVAENDRLQEIFNDRWYLATGPQLEQTYFAFYNTSQKEKIKADTQLFVSYGYHSNAFLLENYGFILDDNPYDSS